MVSSEHLQYTLIIITHWLDLAAGLDWRDNEKHIIFQWWGWSLCPILDHASEGPTYGRGWFSFIFPDLAYMIEDKALQSGRRWSPRGGTFGCL